MNKKPKTTIVATLFFAVIFIIGLTNCQRRQDADEISSSKLIQIQTLLAKGDSLRGSNQDSCSSAYKMAISISQSLEKNEKINHFIGLGYVGLAALHCNMGNYTESEENVCFALKCAKEFDDRDIEAQAINIKGLLCFNRSNLDSALIFYEQALTLAKGAGNLNLQGKIYTNSAIIKFYGGHCNNAIADFSKTLEIAREINDIDLITGTYINMGLVASHFGEYQKAVQFYGNAIEAYKNINGIDGLILCYQNRASLYFLQGNYGRAIEDIQLSLKLANEIGDKSNIAKAYHNMAELYARVGDHQQAMDAYLVSIRRKEDLNDKVALVDGYNGLGALFYQEGLYGKALEYFEKALKTSNEIKIIKGKSTALSSIAGVYVAQNNYNQAIKYYEMALELAVQTDNKSSIADHNINIGSTYAKLQRFEEANRLLNTALSQKKALNEKGGMANAYAELAYSSYQQFKSEKNRNNGEKIRNAEKYALKAFQLASEINEIPLINSTSLLLKQIYTASGNASEALRFAEKYISTTDSIYRKSKAEEVTYAEARWSVEKQEALIKNLENENEIKNQLIIQKELKSKQYKIIIGFAILVVLLLVGFTISLVFFYRRKRDAIYQRQLNDMTKLKMQNIRNRISPHFIFNLLGSVSHSLANDEEAKNKIENMSMLLRNVLENVENTAISFSAELEIVKNYVELQKSKFFIPFNFTIEVEPGVDKDMLIPAMIVQIPVENALKHGLLPKENGTCELRITAKKDENGSLISVIDNGPGLNNYSGKTTGTRTGLKMLMQTIQFLNSNNKNHIIFTLKDKKPNDSGLNGTIADIFIPNDYSYQF